MEEREGWGEGCFLKGGGARQEDREGRGRGDGMTGEEGNKAGILHHMPPLKTN